MEAGRYRWGCLRKVEKAGEKLEINQWAGRNLPPDDGSCLTSCLVRASCVRENIRKETRGQCIFRMGTCRRTA